MFNGPASPIVYIDGPYNTPLSKYNRFKLSILVANGSGLSPFLSIIRSRLAPKSTQNPYHGYTKGKLWDQSNHRLVFVWVIREWDWLSWIQTDLEDLLHLAAEPSQNVQLVVYITGAGAADLEQNLSRPFCLSADKELQIPAVD